MIPDKMITLNEWCAIRDYMDSTTKGTGEVFRDYFFHRRGAKGGTGLAGVTLKEALKVAEIILRNQRISRYAS